MNGIPAVPNPDVFPPAAPLVSQDSVPQGEITEAWGLYDQSGNLVIDPDTILKIDYRNDSRVSNYPQEGGAFTSYNKVGSPYDVKITYACGGDIATRAAFLDNIQKVSKSLELYAVVTPEITYPSATIDHIDYRRETRNGATLLIVDVWVIEIRVIAGALYTTSDALPASQVRSPGSASPISSGPVQATGLTPAQAAFVRKNSG